MDARYTRVRIIIITMCTPSSDLRTWPATSLRAPAEPLRCGSHAAGELQCRPHLLTACISYDSPGRHPRPRVSVRQGAESLCCSGVGCNERSQRCIDSVLSRQNCLKGELTAPPQLAATVVIPQHRCQRCHPTCNTAQPDVQTCFAGRYQLLAAGNRARRADACVRQRIELSAHLVERAELRASVSLSRWALPFTVSEASLILAAQERTLRYASPARRATAPTPPCFAKALINRPVRQRLKLRKAYSSPVYIQAA